MRGAVELPRDHAPHLRQLLHEVRLRVEAPGRVDDHHVPSARLRRLDRVERDRGGIRSADGADEVRLGARRPDLELLLRGGAERVGGAEDDAQPVLAELRGELADRRRLARAVDADDEDHGRRRGHVQGRGLAEHRRDLLRQRLAEVAELAARLQPLDQLGRRRDADVGGDQRLLQPLPGRVVLRVEGRDRDLLRQRPARAAERVAQAAEEALLLLGRLVRSGRVVAQQLSPRPRHGGER